ncbi:MAG: Rieske (2Fe-2S) iron-sulfur domain protein [Planctomycetota bacterium]|nr:Rieske (2Fe-2S) iron-sulfur domain protein [Planctomycetota bacterium]
MSSAITYYPVASVGEIPEGEGRAFEVDDRMIAVFHDSGEYFALDDSCPHQGAPLSDGEICNKTVTCRWHGWRFCLEDGRWLDSPRTQVPTYPVRVTDGRIEVGVPG